MSAGSKPTKAIFSFSLPKNPTLNTGLIIILCSHEDFWGFHTVVMVINIFFPRLYSGIDNQ